MECDVGRAIAFGVVLGSALTCIAVMVIEEIRWRRWWKRSCKLDEEYKKKYPEAFGG